MGKKEVGMAGSVSVKAVKKNVANKTDNKKKTKKKNGSSVAAKIAIKTAMYVVGILIVVLVCKSAFDFGEEVFSAEGMDSKGNGKEVVVTIPMNSNTSEVGEILKENGLIESEWAFMIQTFLYESEIASGTYTLNTEMSAEDIIDAIRPVEKEK